MTEQELAQAADETHGTQADLEHARTVGAALEQQNAEALRLVREAHRALTCNDHRTAMEAVIEAQRVVAGEQ